MLRLRVKAPFAAFRPLTAGSFRPTAPFLTPSAAYGLLLNVAAIEMRFDDGEEPMTLIASGLPSVEIALGALDQPEVQTLYQQLHNYPVGTTGKGRASETKGNKYNIQPIRREFLSDLDAYVCLRGNDELENRVRQGLTLGAEFRPEGKPRYGVPFLGDNSFLISVLQEESTAQPAFWFVRTDRANSVDHAHFCRLTVWIDRQNLSKTMTGTYSWRGQPLTDVPEEAWTLVPPTTVRS